MEEEIKEEVTEVTEVTEEKAEALKIPKTLKEIRKEKIDKMEEKFNSLEDGDYKKKQLEYKIINKKKKWFPKTIWHSNVQGTYLKSTK